MCRSERGISWPMSSRKRSPVGLIASRPTRLQRRFLAGNSSFEAQTDPIVRIEAGRVRRALERYYLTSGQNDPIVITIPKGGYVPAFARRDQTLVPPQSDAPMSVAAATPERPRLAQRALFAIAALLLLLVGAATAEWLMRSPSGSVAGTRGGGLEAPDVPRLIVQSFEDLSGTQNSALIARGLTEEIVGQLAKFKEIIVTMEHSPLPGGAAPSSQSARLRTPRRRSAGSR